MSPHQVVIVILVQDGFVATGGPMHVVALHLNQLARGGSRELVLNEWLLF